MRFASKRFRTLVSRSDIQRGTVVLKATSPSKNMSPRPEVERERRRRQIRRADDFLPDHQPQPLNFPVSLRPEGHEALTMANGVEVDIPEGTNDLHELALTVVYSCWLHSLFPSRSRPPGMGTPLPSGSTSVSRYPLNQAVPL